MITKAQKKWMLLAIGIFLTTSLLVIIVNSLRQGWHIEYSISRYVGLETWSAVVFALGNIAVAGLFGKYLYAVGEAWQMPKWFYVLVVITAAALLGLSACPIGYFDPAGVAFGTSAPSLVHKICSRLMFACMLLMAFVWQWQNEIQNKIRLWCAIFVVYGLVCVTAYYVRWNWFFDTMLVFESVYILGFMVLCWRLQGKIDGKTREEIWQNRSQKSKNK